MDVRYRFFVNCLDYALFSGILSIFMDVDHIPAALGNPSIGRLFHFQFMVASLLAGLWLSVSSVLEMVGDD